MAFSKESRPWECLSSTGVTRQTSDDYTIVKGQTTHFTYVVHLGSFDDGLELTPCFNSTFAVLLSPSEVDECDIDWIWIASLSLVGCSLICVTSVVLAYYNSYRFRSVVSGATGERISKLIRLVKISFFSPKFTKKAY